MSQTKINVDDLPVSPFHRRIALVAAGGPFCDGYLLGIIVVALPFITRNLHLDAVQTGLVGAASLLGMLFGGMLFGPMTDRFGRQSMYVLNLAIFVLCSLAHLFVQDLWGLFALRFVMGIALGADYPIATALAAEFLPKKLRGPVLSSLVLSFWFGYAVSLASGTLFEQMQGDAWRFILASAAVPSLFFLLLRVNVPESPRWLLSVGRREKARQVVLKHLGPEADFAKLVRDTRIGAVRKGLGMSSIREVFARGYAKPLCFCSLFWMCQIAPSFAIKTYQPMLLSAFGVTHAASGSLLIIAFAVVGTALGALLINKVGRRRLLIGAFVLSTLSLLLLATPLSALVFGATAFFVLFTLSEAAGSALQFVYPNEVFPTDLRGTGMGLSLALSRIAAAAGTFLLPMTIARLGTVDGLLIAGGISLFGLLVSVLMAPETNGIRLTDSHWSSR